MLFCLEFGEFSHGFIERVFGGAGVTLEVGRKGGEAWLGQAIAFGAGRGDLEFGLGEAAAVEIPGGLEGAGEDELLERGGWGEGGAQIGFDL